MAITSTSATINYPFGPADVQTSNAATGTLTPAISNALTVLKYTAPAGALTLNLNIDDNIPVGAELVIHVAQTTTGRNVTLGTGFDSSAPDLTGVASDVDVISCVYDGSAFLPKSTWLKVVDAA